MLTKLVDATLQLRGTNSNLTNLDSTDDAIIVRLCESGKTLLTSPQDFLTFTFNSFATLLLNLKAIPSASHKLLNFDRDHFSEEIDFSGQILIKFKL